MDWQTLIAWLGLALSPALALAAIAYIFRETFLRYVTRRIDLGFEERLAQFQSNLNRKDKELHAVRDHLLQSIASESNAVISKKVDSVEGIWNCHCENKKFLVVASFLKVMKIENVDKSIGDEKLQAAIRDIVAMFPLGDDPKKLPISNGEKFRPFLSTNVWSYYNIYQTLIMNSLAIFFTWRSGISSEKLIKTDDALKAVATIMPEYEEYLRKFGMTGALGLLEVIEAKLLYAIDDMLQGKEVDVASAERAQKALELTQASLSQLSLGAATQRSRG